MNKPKLYDSFVKAILDGDSFIRIMPPPDLEELRALPFEEAKQRLEEMLFTEDDDEHD